MGSLSVALYFGISLHPRISMLLIDVQPFDSILYEVMNAQTKHILVPFFVGFAYYVVSIDMWVESILTLFKCWKLRNYEQGQR